MDNLWPDSGREPERFFSRSVPGALRLEPRPMRYQPGECPAFGHGDPLTSADAGCDWCGQPEAHHIPPEQVVIFAHRNRDCRGATDDPRAQHMSRLAIHGPDVDRRPCPECYPDEGLIRRLLESREWLARFGSSTAMSPHDAREDCRCWIRRCRDRGELEAILADLGLVAL